MEKNLPVNAGDARDPGSIPGWGRYPGGANSNPLQYSCLEYPMDRGTWWAVYSPWGHKETQLVTCSFQLMVIISRREPLKMPSHGSLSLSPGHCQVVGQQTADFPWLSSSWLCSLSLAPDPVAGMRHRMGSLSSMAHSSMGAPQSGSQEPLMSFIFKRLR